MLALLDQGLEDISASRSRFTWGVPFPQPLSTGETQTTYVWFDALPNYLTATGFPDAGMATSAGRRSCTSSARTSRASTRSSGRRCCRRPELPLPERVWAHGFVLLGGERFSKSAGVRLDLDEAIDRFGADAFRYFLLREVPFDADGSFSWERFEERYNADLANAWGNLASRVISMVERYCDGVVPGGARDRRSTRATRPTSPSITRRWTARAASCCTRRSAVVWQSVARGNEYVDRQAPWKLAKDPALRAELERTLAALIRQLARHAIHLAPVHAGEDAELWTQLGGPGMRRRSALRRASRRST